MLNEDAPTNNVGGGQIAALGVGPQGEPPGKKKKYKILKRKPQLNEEESEKFGLYAGHKTIIVPREVYFNAKLSKKKYKHWRTYINSEDNELTQRVKEFIDKYPNEPIIFQDKLTGAMFYAKYGSK